MDQNLSDIELLKLYLNDPSRLPAGTLGIPTVDDPPYKVPTQTEAGSKALPLDPNSPGMTMNNPQRQGPVMVQPDTEKILFDPSDKIKINSKDAQWLKANLNPVLDSQMQDIQDKQKTAEGLKAEANVRMADVGKRMATLDVAPERYQAPPALDAQLASVKDQYNKTDVPERSIWADAIAGLLPSILGSMSGTAGAAAALPATQSSVAFNEKLRGEQIALAKDQRDKLKKSYDELIALKKGDQAAWTKEQEFKLNQNKALLDAGKDLAKMSRSELDTYNKTLDANIKDFYGNTQKGALDVAKMDQEANQAAAKAAADANKPPNPARSEMLAERAFARISKDPIIQQIQKSQLGMKNDLHTLDAAVASGKGVLPQVLKEVSNGVANALAMGRANAVSDREAQEYNNVNTVWAKLSTKFSTEGVEPINDPVLFGQIRDVIQRLRQAYQKNAEARSAGLVRPTNDKLVDQAQKAAVKGTTSADDTSDITNPADTKIIGTTKYKKTKGGWEKVK